MMPEENEETRSQRFKNRKRSNLVVKLAIGLVALVAIIFVLEFFIGDPNEVPEWEQVAESGEESTSQEVDESESESAEESVESESESESEEESEDDFNIREVTSEDPNVIRTFVGEWPPIGTEQGEPHVINYDEGSADRIEIKRAASVVTSVPEDDMIEHWIGNNGEQQVTATISQISTGDIYKVYLRWVAGEGWQVTRYEELVQVIQ